jgi:hypothetical protein
MKDQILTSTRNIIKYVNANATYLQCIFKKMCEYGISGSCHETSAKKILGKFIRLIIHIDFYATNKKWENIDKLCSDLDLMYSTFVYIKDTINITDKETKIIKNIIVYLHCVIKLIKKIDSISDISDDASETSVSVASDASYNDTSSCSDSTDVCGNDQIYDGILSICNDKTTLNEAVKKLKCLYDLFNLLKVIIVMLEKQFIQQLNTSYSSPSNAIISTATFDLVNKLLDMYSSQFTSIRNKHCGEIFTDTGDTLEIKIELNNGHEVVLCVIDNIQINTEELDHVKSVVIQIGTVRGLIKYLIEDQTYSTGSMLFKDNIDNLEKTIRALDNNQKLIIDCLVTIHNFTRYNLL